MSLTVQERRRTLGSDQNHVCYLLVFGVCAQAAEVKLLSSNALKSALEELAPQFEKATGHKVVIV